MSRERETKQISHKVGACDQIFVAVQNVVASVNPRATASSENQIWILWALCDSWTLNHRDICKKMKEDHGMSPSLVSKTLKALISMGLARRIRMGVYQANFELIFMEALSKVSSRLIASRPGGEL